jgi:hypothetical protein
MTPSSPPPSGRQVPIFIVGVPRSGTTLRQYWLRNHPHIFLPIGESHFFIPLSRNLESYDDLHQSDNIRHVLKAMHEQSQGLLETDLLEWFPNIQISAFESVASKTLREFGYDQVTAFTPPAFAVKAAYRRHNKVLTRFWKRSRRALA